ncbi:unnamed protein product [Leuciscus chuanchicus]
MSLTGLLQFVGRSLQRLELSLSQAAGFDRFGPALAVNGPGILPQSHHSSDDENAQPSFLDSIFWMAAPKKRRTIEVNRCRRRDPNKLIKVKYNIEPCSECGNMKLKHTLCGFCYEKVRKETAIIRKQISIMEGGPLNTPAVESVVLYENETPSDADKDKRIDTGREVERLSSFLGLSTSVEEREKITKGVQSDAMKQNNMINHVTIPFMDFQDLTLHAERLINR